MILILFKKLERTRTEAIDLNDEQERLKAELKTKTEELDGKMKALTAMLSEAKKIVKNSYATSRLARIWY
ncbi:hypothetical protein CCAN11_1170002 [Capnocytophaga canimorsus]|uniref:Uncharacterized protein n=1 Tax=Capnocytophaga canimorsus TaxID=28188 RepID=A0A0B7I9P9_9FLAO|nr:hypothetical protein CCAN11_1170002 [Capnocytophaga canimorsus]